MSDKVLYEKRDRIAYVTINRPEARNAIDPDVHRLMIEAWADFRDDDSVDVAILTGAGDEAFCAGADLKTYIPPIIERRRRPREIREIVELGLNGFTRGMHRIYKPIIGAINGWALAGGLETALACDIRIASERAMFGSFEARRGFHHGDGGLVRLVNTCGTGDRARDAAHRRADRRRSGRCSANLVSKVVPHERLMEEAETVARQILRNSQRAVRSAKQTILDVDRPAARRPAAHRGLERLHLRRPRGDDGAARAASTRRPTPGRAGDARDRAGLSGWPGGRSSPGRRAGSAPRSPSGCAPTGSR